MTQRPILSAPRASPFAALAIGLALAAVAGSPAARAASTERASLTVTFHGLRAGGGAVMAALTASREAFDGKAAATAQARAAVRGDAVTLTFSDLAPGRYAVRAFHDLNGDGKLGVNLFGAPTEPYAFSNNAKGAPARWDAAAFDLEPGGNVQTIELD
jgi:uncharacterized protein (DUF2141 family)